jgi:hypothetical protein
MGLLEDFETLEKQQTDSIEYFLRRLVLKDQSPELIEHINSATPRDPSITPDKVYVIFELDEKNRDFKIIIGDFKESRCITFEDYYTYVKLYEAQYPNRDASCLYSPLMRHYLFASSILDFYNDDNFIYCTNNHGTTNSKYSRRNHRIKFQYPVTTQSDVYEKYIQTFKIDYSK